MVSFFFLSINSAPILSDLLRMSGNGREESTAIGVNTLIEIEKQLKKRQWGEAIRLEVEDNIDKRLLKESTAIGVNTGKTSCLK